MPHSDFDTSITGRNSRASEFSNGSRGQFQRSGMSRADALAAAPGVLSMLKTSTEIGDVGSLAAPSVRSPALHSGVHRRPGAASRMSTSSAQSQHSNRASYHQAFPSVSSAGRRRSLTSNLTVPPSLELLPGLGDMSDPTTIPPQPAFLKESGRSFSLTNASRPAGFPNYRSLTSLRNHEPIQRPRSPYRYPTRLKRPGYRPSSPALSDVTGVQPSRPQHQVAPPRPKPVRGPPPTQFGRLPAPYPTHRNLSTPTVNIVERLEQKALFFPVPRKPSPAFTSKSLSVSATTRGTTPSEGPPSSDPPSSTPPTPKDVYIAPTPKAPVMDPVAAALNPPVASGKSPVYYDYGEDFHEFEKHVTQVYEETTSSPIPMGFVHRIKALLEERAAGDPTSSPSRPTRYSTVEEVTEPDIPELPASPVVKRITREMILAAIAPTSDVNESEHTIKPDQVDDVSQDRTESFLQPSIAELPANDEEKRKTRLSEQGSITSALSSSTAQWEIALHYNISHSKASLHSSGDPFTPDEDYSSNEITHQEQTQYSLVEESPSQSFPQAANPPSELKAETWKPIPQLEGEMRPATVFMCSSSPLESSSRHSIPTTYTPGQSSKTEDTTADSTGYARQVAVSPASGKGHLETDMTSCIEVEHATVTINVQEVLSPISPMAEDVTGNISGPMSPVSPLNPSECTPTTSRDSISTTHLSTIWSYRKPVPSYAPAIANADDTASLKRSSMDSTTELRFSAYRPNTDQLPDLKEESETSLDRASNIFRFPRPGSGIPSIPVDKIRGPRDSRSSKADSRRDSVFKPQHVHSLSETRAIPSLQFSQINLFAKLNDAFESRRTSSMDGCSMYFAPTPEQTRPEQMDSGIIREKYKSLFGSLDDEERQANGVDLESDEKQEADTLSQHDPAAAIAPTFRPLSPDELIAEVERISIPSINGLTQRLSEFLPSLKKYCQTDGESLEEETEDGDKATTPKDPVEEAVEVTINEIRSIGKELHPEDGQDESETETIKAIESEPDLTNVMGARPKSTPLAKRPETPLNPIPESGTDGDKTPLAELEAATPAVLRARSLSDSDIDRPAHYARISSAFRKSRRSLVGSSPADSRPWNLDTSYPWANNNPDFDIRLPPPTLRKDVVKAQPSRLRLRISEDDHEPSDNGDTVRPSLHRAMSDAGDHTGSTVDTFGYHLKASQSHGRGGRSKRKGSHGKRSLLGSLSRKIGLHGNSHAVGQGSPSTHVTGIGTSIDTSGFLLGTSLLGDDGRPVDPGDRYPTTGLSPPSTYNIEEVRSFFSDDSSQGDMQSGRGKKRKFAKEKSEKHKTGVGGGTLKKRLTSWKTSSRMLARSASAQDTQRNPHSLSLSRTDEFFVDGHAATADGPGDEQIEGEYEHADAMGKTEVRAKRFLEKIKAFWYRGGEILRSMSMKTTRTIPVVVAPRNCGHDLDWEQELDARHSVEITEEIADILPVDMDMSSVRAVSPEEAQEVEHAIEEQVDRLITTSEGTEQPIAEEVEMLQMLGEGPQEVRGNEETEL